ncbi:hypothetical protein BKA80DRAFT_134139 [Phyllosticta citrichinensis]
MNEQASFERELRNRRRRNAMRAAVEIRKHGCMLRIPPGMADMDLDSSTFEKDFTAKWPTYACFWEACRGITSTQTQPEYIDLFSQHQKRLASKNERILAMSQTAALSVECFDDTYNLVNCCDGEYSCYHRLLDGSYCRIRDGDELVGIGSLDDPNSKEEISTDIKFLALTLSLESDWDSGVCFPAQLFRDFETLLRKYDVGPKVLRFIAIKATDEDGGYRRIGAGFISFQKWVELKPEHHAFVLE